MPPSPPLPTLVLLHACCLLEQPQFGTPVLALLDAGTRLNVQERVAGFYAVTYGPIRGFIPSALCRTDVASYHPYDRAMIASRCAIVLLAQPLPDAPALAATQIPARRRLLLLGQDGDFFLVQHPNGALGFLQSSREIYRPIALIPDARACLYDLGWPGLGCGWTIVNAIGAVSFLSTLPLISPELQLLLATLLGGGVFVAISRRRYHDTRGLFIFGVQVCLSALLFLSVFRLLAMLKP